MADISLALADSTAPKAPKPYRPGAPNVLVIVLDDLGFAQLGCYGADIDTPNIDRLAARGVRFTNFHTTAVCSPTRACLLTGRNHHRVGMGMLPETPVNYPGYTGRFPKSAGTIAQVLRAEGWSTTCIGKWHLTPRDERATGPFDMWPTGVGFERYYGFLNGETNQWTPNLIRDQSHVEPPSTPDEGYHLTEDLADEAIRQLRDLRAHSPDRPWFMWFATGAPHAPHQAPDEWIDRYAGRFDDGWDVWRADALERQRRLGIVGDEVELSASPDWVAEWDELDEDRRRLYARMMEVYAAFVSHTDHHIGRVLDHLEASGEADDTIVVLVSDNGSSAEGGPNGSWNQLRHYISDEPDDIEVELAHYDDLGGHRSSGHYPWGWALAGNTPFRRWKRYTYEGGVRDPLIVSWPGGSQIAGELRHQYAHAIDIAPTILDLLGIEAPAELGGVAQMSVDGLSLRAVLEDDGESPRTSQYYECWGSRAIYADGWKAVTNHVNQLTAAERDAIDGSADFARDTWSLYEMTTDPAETTDLAAEQPAKLAELVELWHAEAARNDVLPIDDGQIQRVMQMHTPWLAYRGRFELAPGDKLHEVHGPMLYGGFRMVAGFEPRLDVAAASGVLCEQGDWICGWAWFLADGRVTWVLNHDGAESRVTGDLPDHTTLLAVDATPADGGGLGLTLTADGVEIAAGHAPNVPLVFSPDGSFLTVGYGRPFPVCSDYEPPAPAPESLVRVTVDAGPPPPFDLDAELGRVMRHQ